MKKKEFTELTRAEDSVMQIIWTLKQAFLGEIIEQFKEPRPAKTTIATVIKILENKGFVAHETFGKNHRYYAIVSKEEYRSGLTQSIAARFFDNSPAQLLTAFSEQGKITAEQYDELLEVARKMLKAD